ncbi:DEAD/DEAH box helicase [Shewanella glacialimarina]|uniref:DEAD/DEAH box helicase n=1 Tax=Shewanella glacialimarina TaxID=2590884 RepID=UPI001CF815BF|nr:DEAD/DEAH box helicase [Shewanella glacialimarina]UCX05290.1 DEAD/DEAH box helicase [Shewanella glacialimarina]
MSFLSLGLKPEIQRALTAIGYVTPTPIQLAVIPKIQAGKDILANAETGTGKTAAFALPLIEMITSADDSSDHEGGIDANPLTVLIMTPTRELAIQIEQNIVQFSQFLPIKSVAVYGGASIRPQLTAISQGVNILVATPGRLFDIVGQHDLSLASVKYLVIDEADRMLDLGFVKDIEKVKRLINRDHQTMMFSATFSDEIKLLADDMLISPEHINVATTTTAATVTQLAYQVDQRRKAELLSELIGKHNWQQVMVFTSRKETADHLQKELSLDGIKSAVFHGDKSQGARNKALEEFKSGKLRVLVATDLAARGLDIQALPRVINFELPEEPEDYVHRIGRTGRAGLAGEAISLVSPQEQECLEAIEAVIQQRLVLTSIAGYEQGAPLPARYRELASDPTKTKQVKKHARPNRNNRSGQFDKDSAKPQRHGKYSKKK